MTSKDKFYRETFIKSIGIGTEFLFQGTLFKKVYEDHIVNVGLTAKAFSGVLQAQSFKNEEIVLVRVNGQLNILKDE